MWPVFERPRPRIALLGGVIATLALAAVVGALNIEITRAVPALLLVLVVVFASIVGGRAPGFVVAGVATLAFTFALTPVGSPRVRFLDDFVALAIFAVVAFTVSTIVTSRVSALQKVDEQRLALLRSVSHDLRTPLAAIHAVATDLRDGAEYDVATREQVLDLLIDETERLDRLVANLLSMSRIETGTLRPRVTDVDIASLVDLSAQRTKRLFRGWQLDVDVPEQLPLVRADPAQLEQVVNNLLENVVEHTPAGTRAQITAAEQGGFVEIIVADTGPGLPPRVARLLEVPGVDTEYGIGLAICKAIAEAHGGTIHVDVEHPGTCIAVTVPRTR